MQIAFIVDPLAQLKSYKDSTVAMMAAAEAAGHRMFTCEPRDLSYRNGVVTGNFVPLRLTGETPRWYEAGESRAVPLRQFDAVLMRKDPPFDAEYLYATYVLELAASNGARIFNDPRAVRDHNEKLAILQYPQFTADTLVSRDAAQLRAFVIEQGEAVLKLLDGMGGASIFRARADDPNLSVILETMNQFGARSVMAQRYLPQIVEGGDKRILLIDGEIVPHALARIPKQGESRGNLAAGGRARIQPLSERDREIAETLAPVLARKGLFLVGLDVIGDCLTEINVTSPTGFREIVDGCGFDVARLFIERLGQHAPGGARARR